MAYDIESFNVNAETKVTLEKLTVLVGPNNSGKSRTLLDLLLYAKSGSQQAMTILSSVQDHLPDKDWLNSKLRIFVPQGTTYYHVEGVGSDLLNPISENVDQATFERYVSEPDVNFRKDYYRIFGPSFVAHLGAEERFKLAAASDSFDPEEGAPKNSMQAFFASPKEVKDELRSAFKSAFDMDIALDWSGMINLKLRVFEDFGTVSEVRDVLSSQMREKPELKNQGDGYKSFAGVALAVLTFPERLLLLDEPEAFLHPAQARSLGRWLAAQAKKRSGKIIVASHSADFLAGILSAETGASIVRLNRTKDRTRFHSIPANVLVDLIRAPLLFSQPVLSALFHKGVVICEGDPDRAVYQAATRRSVDSTGGEDVLFIHTNGKDAMKGPATGLRESATPVCAIVDIDVLNSEKTLCEIVTACSGKVLPKAILKSRNDFASAIEGVTPMEAYAAMIENVGVWLAAPPSDLRDARRSLVTAVKSGTSKWEKLKKRGVSMLPEIVQQLFFELIKELKQFGVFVVPDGELETWVKLKEGKGKDWNKAALTEIYNNGSPEKLTSFLKDVLEYLRTEGVLAAFPKDTNDDLGADPTQDSATT